MSPDPMLVLEVAKIPEEGLRVECALAPGPMHLAGEDGFELREGGRVAALAEKGEDESVHVKGRLSARLGVDCGRCLEGFDFAVEQPLDLFFLPRATPQEEEEDVELQDRELVVAYYDGGRIDLGESLREQLFLALPMKRLCRAACRGLCAVCGNNRNEKECECVPPEEHVSPFAKLLRKGAV